MKVQNNNQLLEDFAFYIESKGLFVERINPYAVMQEFLKSSNNLSEIERQPVSNNEQDENECVCLDDYRTVESGYKVCNKCNNILPREAFMK